MKRLDDSKVQYKAKHNMSDIVIITSLAILAKEKDVKNMDGKTINGRSRSELTANKILPTNVMSIHSHDYGMSIIQDFIKEKSNEIPMRPELIK